MSIPRVLLLTLVVAACAPEPSSDTALPTDEEVSASAKSVRPPLWLTFTSHNEETVGLNGDVDYTDNAKYGPARTNLIALVNVMRNRHVAYNWQSDWRFLEGAVANEGNYAPLGPPYPMNVVQWMDHVGVEVNPHHHETSAFGYNYADVAQLFEDLSVTPAATVGGFAFGLPDWTSYYLGIDRSDGSGTWTPELLWGTSYDGSHSTTLYASGMWRPGYSADTAVPTDTATFTSIDPTGTQLPFLPGPCDVVVPAAPTEAQLDEVVLAIRTFYDSIPAGQANDLWEMRIMLNQRNFDEADESTYPTSINTLISKINAEFPLGSGEIAWATPTEIRDKWASLYSGGDQRHFRTTDYTCY